MWSDARTDKSSESGRYAPCRLYDIGVCGPLKWYMDQEGMLRRITLDLDLANIRDGVIVPTENEAERHLIAETVVNEIRPARPDEVERFIAVEKERMRELRERLRRKPEEASIPSLP